MWRSTLRFAKVVAAAPSKARSSAKLPSRKVVAVPPSARGGSSKANKKAVMSQASDMQTTAQREKMIRSNPVAAAVAKAVSASLPAGADPHRDNVIGIFRILANANKTLGEQQRARAYLKAINLLVQHRNDNPGVPLTSAEQVKHLKGIGPKLYIRIDEIIRTGTLRELQFLYEDPNMKALQSIAAISCIGPKTAMALHKIYGVSTVSELRQRVEDGTITSLSEAQLQGLRYHEDFAKPISQLEGVKHEALVQKECRAVHKGLRVTLCGALRRGVPFANELKFVIALPQGTPEELWRIPPGSRRAPLLDKLVEHLKACGYVCEDLSWRGGTFVAAVKLPGEDIARRGEFHLVKAEAEATAILHFTGSVAFVARLREHALVHGYTLTPYGLFKLTDASVVQTQSQAETFRVPTATEEDVFTRIGFPYLTPDQRTA